MDNLWFQIRKQSMASCSLASKHVLAYAPRMNPEGWVVPFDKHVVATQPGTKGKNRGNKECLKPPTSNCWTTSIAILSNNTQHVFSCRGTTLQPFRKMAPKPLSVSVSILGGTSANQQMFDKWSRVARVRAFPSPMSAIPSGFPPKAVLRPARLEPELVGQVPDRRCWLSLISAV